MDHTPDVTMQEGAATETAAAPPAVASLPLPPPLPHPAPSPPSSESVAAASPVPDATMHAPALPPARLLLYRLISRQLLDDGQVDLASAVASRAAFNLDSCASLPTYQLSLLVDSALASIDARERAARDSMLLGRDDALLAAADDELAAADEDTESGTGKKDAGAAPFPALLDLTRGPAPLRQSASRPLPPYAAAQVIRHKDVVTAAAWSPDGALIATGSRDTSIRLTHVARLRLQPIYAGLEGGAAGPARIQKRLGGASGVAGANPLLRTYVDHESAIAELAFHSFEPFLLSASRDRTLKLFNFAPALEEAAREDATDSLRTIPDAASRRATRVMSQESAPLTSAAWHPSGDWLLAACDEPIVRMYDARSFAAYVSNDFTHFHSGAVNCVRWHPTRGSSYATASADGSVKLWDGVSNSLIRTLDGAHDGAEVLSVEYSPSGRYLLSTGRDCAARLWDVASGRCVQTYRGARFAGLPGVQHTFRAAFESSGEWILCGDEATSTVVAWDARTGELVKRLDGAHTRAVRAIATAPVGAHFLSCGDDSNARLWAL